MNRRRRLLSSCVAVPALCAWIAVFNHCALAASTVPSPAGTAVSECPFHAQHTTPKKHKPLSNDPCCKILRATLLASPAQAPARVVVHLPAVDFEFPGFTAGAPAKIFFASDTLDTGPPEHSTFADFIQSMRAHAPPREA